MNYTNLEERFKPFVQKIIDDNKRFYQFNNEIKWGFFVNQDKSVIASINAICELKINIVAVLHAFKIDQLIMIEFFILHEIRHIYQRLYINSNESNKELAEKYKYEFENYCSPQQNLKEYYSQQIEFEAYIFSYSVIIYKYGKINYISYPDFYDEQDINVKEYVKKWIQLFSTMNL